MKRSALGKLRDKVRVDIGCGVTCVVIPSELAALNTTSDDFSTEVCRRVFVEVIGMEEDDGTPCEDTLELRREIFTSSTVAKEIGRAHV